MLLENSFGIRFLPNQQVYQVRSWGSSCWANFTRFLIAVGRFPATRKRCGSRDSQHAIVKFRSFRVASKWFFSLRPSTRFHELRGSLSATWNFSLGYEFREDRCRAVAYRSPFSNFTPIWPTADSHFALICTLRRDVTSSPPPAYLVVRVLARFGKCAPRKCARVSSDSYSRNLPVKNSRNRFPGREKGRREESFASKYIFERIPSNHIFVNGPFENNICDYVFIQVESSPFCWQLIQICLKQDQSTLNR